MLGLSGATKKEAGNDVFVTEYPPTLHLNVSWQSLTFDCSLSVKNNSGVQPAGQCGTCVKEPEGGLFTSPSYPNKYPPDRECIYIIEGKKIKINNLVRIVNAAHKQICHVTWWGLF